MLNNPRSAVLVLLLGLATLAGCIGDADDDLHDHDHDHDHDGHGHADDPAQNDTVEPELVFQVDVHNGTVPLTVNFTWAATGLDGNATFWELDLDGNGLADASGEETSGVFTHTYEEAGTWNVTLTVSDGNHTLFAEASVEATVFVEPEPEVVAFFEGEADFVTGISSGDPEWALQCPGFVLDHNGDGCVFFAFEEDLSGLPYLMEASISSLRWAFWSACSPTADGISSSSANEDTHQGEVPDGAGCVIIWSAATSTASAPIEYRFTVFAS
jgi:PKD repeat protein